MEHKTYNTKLMNNAKWKRLFLVIFSRIAYIQYCEINDFFSSSVSMLKTNIPHDGYDYNDYNDCIDNCLFETGEYAVSYRKI